MTDYESTSNEEMVSWFITGTCQLIPKSFSPVSDQMHDIVMSKNLESREHSIFCGSVAEFYIRPLNTCIGDFDILICQTDQLVVSGDFPVLPSDMTGLAETIQCYKIETYQRYPGFVRLRDLGEMKYNWKYKKYEFNVTARPGIYLMLDMAGLATSYFVKFRHTLNENRLPSIVCGPAIKSQNDSNFSLGGDAVKSLFCPQWPTEAKNWPIRQRNCGWPTIDTISEVVQNGCHVVYVQHRSCRNERLQWRYSFSFAEVLLLQSWTQIQQIVYHLLRFFAKKELIQKDCPKEDEVLCPYHLKTLMLWTCEEMSLEWWNSTSVIAICCELLQKLSEWLKRRNCPNYFIPEANLFYESSSSSIHDKTQRRLNEFHNSAILCQWFVENYILPITRAQFKFSYTKKVVPDFMDYMLPLFEYRKASETKSLDLMLSARVIAYNKTCRCIITYGLGSGWRHNLKMGQYTTNINSKLHCTFIHLPTTEKVLCFKYYDFLLSILHIAHGLDYEKISWDTRLFVEFLCAVSIQSKIIQSQYHNFPKTYTTQNSRFYFLCARNLMENLTGSNSRPECQVLSLISKEFLRRALKYDDSKFNGIAPAALAYLSALHFATSEYKQAKHFCSAVFEDHTLQTEKETLNAGCLLFIDDVARVVGLCVLHRKITDNNLLYIGKRIYLDLRLSPEVFAHYLTVLSAERIFEHLHCNRDLNESAFPMDEYFKTLIHPKYIASMKSSTRINATRQSIYCRTGCLTETEAANRNPLMAKETVIDALMEYALEIMTKFYSVIHKDFGIKCNTADCYRALYLYKCRQYDELLHLCKGILCESDLQSDFKKFGFTNVWLLPPLDSFFDRDVQSLLGFHTLLYYLSPLNDKLRKFNLTARSTFARWFALQVVSQGLELSISLGLGFVIKCHYFLGRHFLARYLKVRSYIDCNLPYSEALTEFVAHKTNLPFERIIRKFLLQKLRVAKNSYSV